MPSPLGAAMRAAVLEAPGRVRRQRVPVPVPAENEVLLAVEATGVCGTDIAVYSGRYRVATPVIMGHEFAGRVAAVGAGVDDLETGTRAIAEGSWQLREGADDSVCVRRLGRTVDGSFAEYVVVPRQAVHVLPEEVSALEAQSLTTAATAVHACDRAGELVGAPAAIIGAGHAGLLVLQVCRARKPAGVTVVGRRARRLALACRPGADTVVDVDGDSFDSWRAANEGRFDVVIEASGTAAGLATAFELASFGARIVVYGIITGELSGVSGKTFYAKELNVLGSNGGDTSYGDALDLMADGAISIAPIVTSVLSLDEVERGLALASDRSSDEVRIVFRAGTP